MKTTSIKIRGLLGYHSIHKPDAFTVNSGKPAYKLLLGISDETLGKLKSIEGVNLKARGGLLGNSSKLKELGIDGTAIQAKRNADKGKVEVVGVDGEAYTGLIGYGSTVVVEGFISNFSTAKYGDFTNFYIDKIYIENLVEVSSKEEESGSSSDLSAGII